MAVPGLVQHVQWRSNDSSEALGGNAFKFTLPNNTLASNCLIMALTYPSAVTSVTITDNIGNTWPATPTVSVTDSGNSAIFAVFILLGATAGVNVITVTFNAVQFGVHAAFQEWYNIATASALDTSNSINVNDVSANLGVGGNRLYQLTGAPISPTTNGDLIMQFGRCTDQGGAEVPGTVNFMLPLAPFSLVQADNVMGYFCQTWVQPLAAAINPVSQVHIPAPPSDWNAIVVALKSANAGTAPSSTAARIVGVSHFSIPTTPNVTSTYNQQFPTMGTMQAFGISDPGGSTTLVTPLASANARGNIQPTGVVRTNATSNSQFGYIVKGQPNPNEIFTLGATDTPHGYYQGVAYDAVNLGNFDTDIDAALGSFGPGNSPAQSFTPGVSNGIAFNVTGQSTGPPDALVTPAAGFFISTFYTNETDLSKMDNGDFHAVLTFSSNAAQSWVYHNTAATSGAGPHITSFTLCPIITAQPTNQQAYPGQSITFGVTATASAGSNTYQWYKDGTAITGATSSTYSFSPNWQADYGSVWYCIVTDSNGSAQTAPVQVNWVPEASLPLNVAQMPAAPAGYVQLNAFDIGDQDFKSEMTLLRWF